MSRGFLASVSCAVCGCTQKLWGIGSSSAFGYPDLDGRPPSPSRGEVYTGIQCCEQCGYCAGDISQQPTSPAILQMDEYKAVLHDETLDTTCRHHLCSSLIKKNDDQYGKAALSALRAAWVCDDKRQKRNANKCRLLAVRYLQVARMRGQLISATPETDIIIHIDMLRRSCHFKAAYEMAAQTLLQPLEETTAKVLHFELQLIASRDKNTYTIGNAIGGLVDYA